MSNLSKFFQDSFYSPRTPTFSNIKIKTNDNINEISIGESTKNDVKETLPKPMNCTKMYLTRTYLRAIMTSMEDTDVN